SRGGVRDAHWPPQKIIDSRGGVRVFVFHGRLAIVTVVPEMLAVAVGPKNLGQAFIAIVIVMRGDGAGGVVGSGLNHCQRLAEAIVGPARLVSRWLLEGEHIAG